MKRKTLNFLLYLGVYIVSILMLIGVDLLRLSFDWSIIDAKFIGDKSLIATLFFIIAFTVTLMTYDFLELKDDRYTKLEKVLEAEAIKLMGSKFNNAIGRLDWYEKKLAWQRLIESKLFNHNAKASRKVREELLYSKPEAYSKKTKRHIEKEEILNKSMTKEWMDRFLYLEKLDYETIEAREVLYGTRKLKTSKSKLVRNPLGRSIGMRLAFFIPTFLMTIVFSVLQQGETISFSGVAIMIGGLILNLLWNTLTGIRFGYRAHGLRLDNTRVRMEIIVAYKEGEYDKLEDTPKNIYKLPNESEAIQVSNQTVEEVIEPIEEIPETIEEIIEETIEEV